MQRYDRRTFLEIATAAGAVMPGGESRSAQAQGTPSPSVRTVRTAVLDIAVEESGPASGVPVILLHGFPDDVRAWDQVAAPLTADGFRAIVPYLRGYGPTRFRNPS